VNRFEREQKDHWSKPDAAHERWRALEPIQRLEEALLARVPELLSGERLLDVGCGEGDALRTLRALGFRGGYTGVDFSPQKLGYAHRAFEGAGVAAADGAWLPFRARAFPLVLCRDLLHHVGDREAVVAELLRVADRRLVVIEPNPLAPLIAGLALVRRVERGMLASAPPRLRRLLTRPGWTTRALGAEPQSLARLVFHYQFGVPRLASSRWAAGALAGLDRAAALLPEALWSYQVFVLDRA
jgi:SAM-dependent methyltransferase